VSRHINTVCWVPTHFLRDKSTQIQWRIRTYVSKSQRLWHFPRTIPSLISSVTELLTATTCLHFRTTNSNIQYLHKIRSRFSECACFPFLVENIIRSQSSIAGCSVPILMQKFVRVYLPQLLQLVSSYHRFAGSDEKDM
jgi:hypothetical protein